MSRKRRQYNPDYKFKVALEAAKGTKTVSEIAALHEIHPNQVRQWKRQYVRQVYNLSEHISEVLAPRIRRILNEIHPDVPQDYSSLLAWEASGGKRTHKSSLWLLPIEAARYGLPIFGGLISYVAYSVLVIHHDRFHIWIDGAISLFCLNLFVYTVYATFRVRRLFLVSIHNQ